MKASVMTSPFQQALEVIERLPTEDQASLIEIIQQRLAELRRVEIARNARDTLQAFREGRAHYGTIQDLQRDVLSEP